MSIRWGCDLDEPHIQSSVTSDAAILCLYQNEMIER